MEFPDEVSQMGQVCAGQGQLGGGVYHTLWIVGQLHAVGDY